MLKRVVEKQQGSGLVRQEDNGNRKAEQPSEEDSGNRKAEQPREEDNGNRKAEQPREEVGW